MTSKELCECSTSVEDALNAMHILEERLNDDNLEMSMRKDYYREVVKQLIDNLNQVEKMCGLKLTTPKEDVQNIEKTIRAGYGRMLQRSQLEDAQMLQNNLKDDLINSIYACGE